MSGADNAPVGRDHLEYLELQRAQAAAIAATADLNMSDMVATAAAAASPSYNSNDFTSTFSALPPRSAMNKLIMNYLVTGETKNLIIYTYYFNTPLTSLYSCTLQ